MSEDIGDERNGQMKNLFLSAYAVNFCDHEKMHELLRACSFAGMGAELSMFSKKSKHPDFMETLMQVKDSFGAYDVSFHGPYFEVEATSPLDSEAHRDMIDAYREAFEVYEAFSAESIVMHTNQKIKLSEDNSDLQNNAIETIKEIGAMAREKGVNLLVENVGNRFTGNVLFPYEEFIQLFDRIPEDIGCLIDVGHAFHNGWDVVELVKRLGSRIKAYHLHNNDGEHDTHRLMFTEGQYYTVEDWKSLMIAMEEYSPNASWILEYAPGEQISNESVVEDVRKLLGLRRELGFE